MLTILSVAFPFAPVGPDPVGGAEHILALLDAYLVREGHASIVLARADSRVAGELVAAPGPAGAIDDAAWARAHAAYRDELSVLLRDRAIDVVHLHGADFASYLPAADVPVIATLHLPPAWYPPEALRAPGLRRICVSRTQRRACPPDAVIAGVIGNGVAVERYRPAARKAGFVVALGRLCREKGFDLALRAARAAGVPLVLAGQVFPYPEHERYVRDELVPLLDADRRWIGPVAGAHKRRLLAEARCLLVTSRVDETSSLVAMEALASGTPVAGLARGALPEIVQHGVTGWLVDDEQALPEAIARASALAPAACRAAAKAGASAADMAARYLALYREAAARPRPRPRPAADVAIVDGDAALAALAPEWDALCARCPAATPFQRPGWLLAWRRWFGAGGAPRVVTVRGRGRLLGLVPLELRGRTLQLIGTGNTDYLDAIVEPEVEPAVLAQAIERAAAGAAAIDLLALRPGSPLLALDLGAAPRPGGTAVVVPLPPARVPSRLGQERRRFEREGAVRWEDETGDLDALLAGLFALHRARWRACGQPGVLEAPGLEPFHHEAAAALHARGLLRMVGLRLDEELAGVLYGFADHGRFMFYLSGFSPDLAALSPGRLLIARAFERAAEEGTSEFDFLRGREPYKYAWGAVDRPLSELRATRSLEEDPCSECAGR